MEQKTILIGAVAILAAIIIVGVILSNKNQENITNYQECINAGYNVTEVHQNECTTPEGKKFTEPITSNETIGGQKDEHGCLIPAGYSWNSTLNACVREWELDKDERKAVLLASAEFSSSVTIEQVEYKNCTGCYNVHLKRNDNDEKIMIKLKNWKLTAEGEYICPDVKTIDCMPIVTRENQKYCSGEYHDWIAENCDVEFTF
ncbi:MAG: hypothetical protein ACOYT4_04465 [Nanoarchaeota archaeon]